MKYPIIRITWRDATGVDEGWLDLEDVLKQNLSTIHTVGMLIADTDEYVTIALSYDEDNKNIAGYLTIPRVCITTIEHLQR